LKAKRIVVSKGRTWPSGEDEWTKEHYEVEVEVENDSEIPYARDWAISLIDGWLQAVAPKPKPEAPPVEAPPERAKTLMAGKQHRPRPVRRRIRERRTGLALENQ